MQPGLRIIAPARRVVSPLNSIAVFSSLSISCWLLCTCGGSYSPTRATAVRALSPNHWTTREFLQFFFNDAQQNFKNMFYISLKLFTHVFYFSSCATSFLCFILQISNRVQFSHSVVSDSLWPHGLQHSRLPCPSPTPRAHSNSCPSSRWCHPTISSSVIPFSSCLQSFPASGCFPMSQFFQQGYPRTFVYPLTWTQ